VNLDSFVGVDINLWPTVYDGGYRADICKMNETNQSMVNSITDSLFTDRWIYGEQEARPFWGFAFGSPGGEAPWPPEADEISAI